MRNGHSQEKPKETWQLNGTQDPGPEKAHYVKTKEIWVNYGLQLLRMDQYWFINFNK